MKPRSISRKASAVILAPTKSISTVKADYRLHELGLDLPARGASLKGVAARASSHAGELCCLQKACDTTALAATEAQRHAESIEHVLKAEEYLRRTRKQAATDESSLDEKVQKLRAFKADLQQQEQEAGLKRQMARQSIQNGRVNSQHKKFDPIHVQDSVGDDVYKQYKRLVAESKQVSVGETLLAGGIYCLLEFVRCG